jgi:hypothetical protein
MLRFLLGAIASTLVACTPGLDAGEASRDQLLSRASFDLDCPRSQIRTFTIDDRTAGVRGCGQRATYVEQCDHDRFGSPMDCTWVLNADARRRRQQDGE